MNRKEGKSHFAHSHYFRKTFSENELRASANDLTVTYTLAPDAVLQGSPAIQ